MDGINLAASLNLNGSVTASVTGVSVQLNRAGGTAVNGTTTTTAMPLDWADDLDLTGQGTYGAKVDPGATLPTPVNLQVAYTGAVFSVSGTLANLNLFNLLSGSAAFAISVSTINVSFSGQGNPDLTNASLITIALSNLRLAVGTGSFGLAITSGNLGIAAIEAPEAERRHRQPVLDRDRRHGHRRQPELRHQRDGLGRERGHPDQSVRRELHEWADRPGLRARLDQGPAKPR